MTTIEALRLKIDPLQLENQHLEAQNLKLAQEKPTTAVMVECELEKNRYKDECEILMVENGQLKALYEELLKKIEEESVSKLVDGDKANETATIMQQLEAQQADVLHWKSKCEQLEKNLVCLESWKIKCSDLERELNALEGWKSKCAELQLKVNQIENNLELECFRAVAKERKQWEAREQRLVQQLQELQQHILPVRLSSKGHHQSDIFMTQNQGEVGKLPQTQQVLQQVGDKNMESSTAIVTDDHIKGNSSGFEELRLPSQDAHAQSLRQTVSGDFCAGAVDRMEITRQHSKEGIIEENSPNILQTKMEHGPVDNIFPVCSEPITAALLAQQLPPLPKFSGERNDGDMETFQDWLEQFEMIANICGWSLQAKLVNLVTRLRGQAYAFFRSCTIQQKTSYVLLVAELQKRFTPVQLQTVQSSLFHDRKQKTGESVDDYAQDLRTLFHKAYPYAQQGTQEAERLGQLVLVNQFVARLLEDIKAKVVGIEGGFDQLLSRARFEEAKLRDLAATSSLLPSSNRVGLMLSTQSSGFTANPPGSNNKQQKLTASRFHSGGQRIGVRCYNCGSPSHFVIQCPYAARSRSTETSGIRNVGHSTNKACVSNVSPAEVVSDNHEQTEKREEKINHESNDTDIGEDINKVVVTMHGVTSTDVLGDVKLGSVLTSTVKVEGEPVEALLDTGSPVTIISLEWLLQVLARQRCKGQNPDEWKAEVENRLAPTAMVLQNYSGDKLRIVRQIRLTLARSGFVTETFSSSTERSSCKIADRN